MDCWNSKAPGFLSSCCPPQCDVHSQGYLMGHNGWCSCNNCMLITGRGKGRSMKVSLRRLSGSFIQHSLSYNLITWPQLTIKEPKKWSLLMAAMGLVSLRALSLSVVESGEPGSSLQSCYLVDRFKIK